MNLNSLTLKQTLQGLEKKEFSSYDVTKACLDHIEAKDTEINGFINVLPEQALEKAKEADINRANGVTAPLFGVPIAMKDNFNTKGVKTTAASNILEDFTSPYDATVTKRLKDAGIILVGKTNMDAWAHGSSTETSDFGTTKNPWDTTRLPGGSSGGAAAVVAADEVIASIGSETAGSIRQPAAWCGTVGLKPTYGRVSRYGVIAMASSLDSPGPITKTVEDSALLLNIIAGHDPLDATTSATETNDYTHDLQNPLKGLRVGISEEYFNGVDEEIKKAVKESLRVLEEQGAEIISIKLFDPQYAIAVYTIIQRSEVSSNLARYDGIRYGKDRSHFGEEAKRRIMLGTYTLSAGYYDQYYNKALKVRTVIIDDFKKAFENVDVIIGPTTPVTALPVGSSKDHHMFGETMDMLVEPSSIAGLPGINVPCGFDSKNLPIGLQIIGPHFTESKILNVAYQYEQATQWHKLKSKV